MKAAAVLAIRRIHVQLGWKGYAGLGMLCLALTGLSLAWLTYQRSLHVHGQATRIAQSNGVAAPSGSAGKGPIEASPLPALPRKSMQVALLNQIERAAEGAGLNWSKVDYSLTPLSDNSLASLEIKGVLKGPYPAIRDFLSAVLSSQPATGLRSLSLTRESAESPDVEARMSLVIYLGDGWAPSSEGGTP